MATPTLPDIVPTVSSAVSKTYNVKEARFGDGYSQRAVDGINNVRRVWSLVWENYDNADVATLEAFFDARGGAEPFFWTPPCVGELERKWIANRPQKRPNGPSASTLSVVFTEVFDLGP